MTAHKLSRADIKRMDAVFAKLSKREQRALIEKVFAYLLTEKTK